MELRHRDPEALKFRLRVFTGCVILLALAFSQSPGFLTFDTKFDLVIDPWHYLGRAVHLWDSNGAIGQLQNQAYGYLWPMGPFFGVGIIAGIPPWAVQRLFMALVLGVGFGGTAYVARALGVRSHLACLLAGFAYALSPRMLTTVGTISIESWPSALAPWVLLPLVIGSTRGSPRRAAALAGLAVAMVGGVNATASFGVIPVAAVWLLTRSRGPRKRSLMVWWPVFTALGTLWWLIPLVLLGKYSPPFLDFIESSSLTTHPTTLFDSLRGTSDWVPYIDNRWRAGTELITQASLVVNSGVVMMVGLLGLMAKRNEHRAFLAISLLLGLALVGMGHTGPVQGIFAPFLNDALDGPLAAARNVHKFDPIVRLPLVLGLALLLESLRAPHLLVRSRSGAMRSPAFVSLAWLAVIAVIGAAMPGIQGRMAPSALVTEVPNYWAEASAWLDDQHSEGAALMSPGIGVAQFVWGSTNDEPLEFLVKQGRFGVRSNIPFVPPGNIRALDAIEERLTQGRPSRGLAPFLARSGVQYLVVRNDVLKAPDIPDTVLLHQALDGSPGLSRLISFGPELGGGAHLGEGDDRNVINGGWQTNYRAIEIYEVASGGPGAAASEQLPLVVGGPESLLDLADAGVIGEEPTVLASDADPRAEPSGPLILTDGYRDRERFFGQIHDGYSAMTLPGQPRQSTHPTKDFYLNKGDDKWRTTAKLVGAKYVGASSSMSDGSATGGARPAESALAAVDGDPSTEWVSDRGSYDRPAWTIELDSARDVRTIDLTAGVSAPRFQTVRVVTEQGHSESVDLGALERATVTLPPGATRWIRVETVGQDATVSAALSEVRIPGVEVHSVLVLPTTPQVWGDPGAVLLTAAQDARTGCVTVDAAVRCREGRDVEGEEDTGFRREFELSRAGSYIPEIWVRPRSGTAVEQSLVKNLLVNVTSSSQAVPDVRASALAAVDGDPGTAWMASVADFRPTLSTRWVGRTKVDGISIKLDPNVAGRMPEKVQVTYRGGSRDVELSASGEGRFPAVRTDFLTIEILQTDFANSIGFDRSYTPLAAAISELRIKGAPFETLPPSTQVSNLPCGSGPDVTVNGRVIQSRIVSSAADVFAGKEQRAQLCDTKTLALVAGTNRLAVASSDLFSATRVVLRSPDFKLAPSTAVSWAAHDADSRGVEPPAGSAVVAFRENANAGWVATQGGADLAPVRIDGWQQGWVLNARSSGALVEHYAPEKGYRLGLVLGLVTALMLLGLVLWWSRRPPSDDPLPVGGRAMRPWLWTVSGAFALCVIAGWSALAVMAVTYAIGIPLGRRLLDLRETLLAACVVVASFFYAIHPWGHGWAGDMVWPQLLCVASLSGVLLGVAEPTWRRRIIGRSTKR